MVETAVNSLALTLSYGFVRLLRVGTCVRGVAAVVLVDDAGVGAYPEGPPAEPLRSRDLYRPTAQSALSGMAAATEPPAVAGVAGFLRRMLVPGYACPGPSRRQSASLRPGARGRRRYHSGGAAQQLAAAAAASCEVHGIQSSMCLQL